jgi:hypothetical protein
MRERLKHRRISASCKQSCEYSRELLVRRDRDSKAAGTTLVCHCRCSAVSGSMLLKAGAAGFDDAACVRTRIVCSTGSKPGALALLRGCGFDDVCCA